FMASLKKDANTTYERINLFSTKENQGAYYAADGQLSFSHYFWTDTNRGMNVKDAFLNARRTLITATQSKTITDTNSSQQSQLDDDGDGLYNSKIDGALAKVTYLGLNAATATTFPTVFAHQGDKQVDPNSTLSLSAQVDLPPEYIKEVWALIRTPSQILSNTAISDMQTISLSYNSSTRSYTGITPTLTTEGEYLISYFAKSTQDNLSEPLTASIQVGEATSTATENKNTAPQIPEDVQASFLEGDDNNINYYLLKLSKPLTMDIRVDYTTEDDTAKAGLDYHKAQGTATISAGQTYTTIAVEIIGDNEPEQTETFSIKLTNPQGISFPYGKTEIIKTRTILDDD
ncbi:MAG: hypothetical protein HQL46_14880, partial [Gammaproteobacteria bacterium]|nr:hypothetical protein [Gammaproteobacteria bacterium]